MTKEVSKRERVVRTPPVFTKKEMKHFNPDILAPIPVNKEVWLHYIEQQINRAKNCKDKQLLDEYLDYLFSFIVNGYCEEEG